MYNNHVKNDVRINVIVNLIRTLVLTLLSFITFPWVCRYLGDSALGTYTWANTFVGYFLILAKIGLPNLAVRECVKVRDNKEVFSNKVQSFFLLQLITTVLSFGLMCFFVFFIAELKNNNAIIFLLAINFLSGVFSFEWVFIALEKQFYMSVRNIVILAVSAAFIIIFVTNPDDIYIYALITVSGTIITSIINIIMLKGHVSFKKNMPYSYKEYIKPLCILCALSLIVSLYNQIDTSSLGFIDTSKEQVASYSVGTKGVDIIIGIITSLSTVFIPRAAYYYQKEDKKYFNNLTKYSFNICLFIVMPAIVTMCVLSKEICGLISGNYNFNDQTSSYYNAPYVLMTLSSMMVTYSIGDIIFNQILLPMKKEKYYLIAMFIGTIINIGFALFFGNVIFKNTTLGPAFGVAIGTAFTDVLLIVFLLIITRKWIKKAIFNFNNLKLLFANIIIAIVSIIIYKPLYNLWDVLKIYSPLTLVLEILAILFIDGIIYIVFLLLVKEDLVYSFIRKKNVEIEEQKNG